MHNHSLPTLHEICSNFVVAREKLVRGMAVATYVILFLFFVIFVAPFAQADVSESNQTGIMAYDQCGRQ
ncbi:hypothetical protein [Brucella anthropi]|uniref:hypothetical protein n=1 Tax=Brucella anthropi TaxID=529 RepID=UPI00384EADE8